MPAKPNYLELLDLLGALFDLELDEPFEELAFFAELLCSSVEDFLVDCVFIRTP